MKKKIIKEDYSYGIPQCNNESKCTIEFINDELVLTILQVNREESFKDFLKGLLEKPDYSKTIRINRKDILGLELGELKGDNIMPIGLIGSLAALAKDQALKLSVNYNNRPIDIHFRPSFSKREAYQEILSFWHS
jgi:hypothetical protein